jgi:uncharacterized SAM-binding protein YcdF (DUF218 family)
MKLRKSLGWLVAILILAIALRYLVLPAMGSFLVDTPQTGSADAAVVLSTGVDYYPRLMEAAALFREGRIPWVVINGNRKTDALRELEAMGYEPPAPWDEAAKRMLEVLGVPRESVIAVNAEDVYDTISEARTIAPSLQDLGLQRLLIVTSRFHTRRAAHIWRNRLEQEFQVGSAPARRDPFDSQGWWRSGRQIRQLMAEYGGWAFYYWSLLGENS